MPRQRKPARLFQRKDDGAWVIIDGTKQVRTGFGDGFREDAEKKLSEYIAQRHSHIPEIRDPYTVTVGEILFHYGMAKKDDVVDTQRLAYTIEALAPYWGNKRVSEISPETCRGYTKWRNLAPSTVRREMTTLNAAVKYAAATRKITYAPIVKLPPKGIPKDRWLTQDEVRKLLAVSAPHVQRFIKLAIYTGRRKKAITGLQWAPSEKGGWVDLDEGVIHFLGRAESETKKKKGIVKMPKLLLEEMKLWDRDCSHVIHFKGMPLDRIDKAFRAAVERAGLHDVTPHTLKHTAVTWAFQRGMTMEDATAYFSTSRETLENVYRSYSPDALKSAASIMNVEI